MDVQRIALVGAESTGKTTLADALAQSLPAVLVSEYLREFSAVHQRPPVAHEQAGILGEQLRREEAALARAGASNLRWVVCDTTPLQIALNSSHYFADDSLLPGALNHQRRYAITFLTEPDLPWEPDGFQRDGPLVRAHMHGLIESTLTRFKLPFVRLHGSLEHRLAVAHRSLMCSDE